MPTPDRIALRSPDDPNTTVVWLTHTASATRAHLQPQQLSASSWQRWSAFSNVQRQSEFLQSRGLLLYALKRRGLDLTGADLDDSGPAPKTQAGWFVSLSHSRGLCAVSCDQQALGVDIERSDRVIELRRLAPRILPDDEAGWVLATCNTARSQSRYLRIWTAREAAFKAGLIPLVSAGPSWITDGKWSAPFACQQRCNSRYVLSVVSTRAAPPLRVMRLGPKW